MSSALCIVRTPWRDRLLFNTWRKPFPHLFHRWDVVEGVAWYGGFWRKTKAEAYVREAELRGEGRGPQTDGPPPNPDKYDDLWTVANKLRNALHLSAMGQNPDTAAVIREADEVLHGP